MWVCHKAATNSLQFEEIQNFADAMMLNAIPQFSGIWHTPLGNTKRPCLILQKNQTAMKQNAPQRVLQNVRRLFSARFSITEGNAWMSTLNNSVQYISVIRPGEKVAKLVKRMHYVSLCRDVPV